MPVAFPDEVKESITSVIIVVFRTAHESNPSRAVPNSTEWVQVLNPTRYRKAPIH